MRNHPRSSPRERSPPLPANPRTRNRETTSVNKPALRQTSSPPHTVPSSRRAAPVSRTAFLCVSSASDCSPQTGPPPPHTHSAPAPDRLLSHSCRCRARRSRAGQHRRRSRLRKRAVKCPGLGRSSSTGLPLDPQLESSESNRATSRYNGPHPNTSSTCPSIFAAISRPSFTTWVKIPADLYFRFSIFAAHCRQDAGPSLVQCIRSREVAIPTE